MSKVTMLNMAGQEAGQIELKDEIFGIEPNQNAVHAVIKNILANRRQGTQSARPELKSEEVAESRSDRREQDATDREAQQTLHRLEAALYSHRSQEATDTHYLRS